MFTRCPTFLRITVNTSIVHEMSNESGSVDLSYFRDSLSGSLDKESPIPLFFQIKQILLRYIARCEEGDVFPAETQLCEVFSVSRPTVRQAIAELVQEGLVERTAGRGTFVTASRVRRDFRLTFQTFDHEMRSAGRSAETEILDFKREEADEIVATQLGISAKEEVYRLQRKRSTNGISLMTVITYLPADLLPSLEEHVDELVALRYTIEHVYKLRMVRATRRMEAVYSETAQASILGIAVGVPIQYIETHGYLDLGRCVEYSRAWYRGDRSSFFIELDRRQLELHT